MLETVGAKAFDSTKLCEYINDTTFPKLYWIGDGAFGFTQLLKEVRKPNTDIVLNTGVMARGAENLKVIDLKSFSIDGSTTQQLVFYEKSSLDTFIIRKSDAVVTMPSRAANIFYRTPIKDGTGYIYVHSALVESYKSATGWAAFGDQIRAIEDYPEICGGEA
jgi:hypothetical protein